MKKLGTLLLIGGILFALSRGIFHGYAMFKYEQEIGTLWEMADRSSTISQKSEYITKFVNKLESEIEPNTYNALLFVTPQDGFNENIKALKSLQNRLVSISQIDENSLAYQTAIQQITQQEQGEAKGMLEAFEGCWQKENFYTHWNIFICIGFLIIQAGAIVFGAAIVFED